MEIVNATADDIPVIHELAEKIWWPTYRPILSDEQISFMLKNMYSEDALLQQIQSGMKFILVKRENHNVAFAGYSKENEAVLKIHKIYVLPSEQGKGTGKNLIEYLTSIARELSIPQVELNVNRANPALGFYEKMGFEIAETVDIPYHQFVLNDYVMRKKLS
ncbi:GNAT family N-acetyltransferase [Daejeonella lutea]|uniref:Ribosomal protein S18 acetylase RimI n=1 Tax=Daejeonella lutea TaxID=572036 RepID=A0A1T5DRT2_9SPHI|nr:GNAT family N-acetyltransferase [Daejeonella lutea]SKB74355.1 Ribosomal protein S18 acetylase RimI [Daejeonella lutea]